MTKLFSLISGSEIRLPPGEKIIPAEDFTTLKMAVEILDAVEKEAIAFKEKAILETEEKKAEGHEKGFQEGLVALNKHILGMDRELKHLREDVQKKILPLALTAAKKIVGEELRLHPDRVVDIVLNSLKPVTQHHKITIYVNKADLAALEESKDKIRSIFEKLDRFSIQDRSDVEPGGCMIETEAGIINAQLENQWRALEAAFEAFTKK